jgi:hypothetical protein
VRSFHLPLVLLLASAASLPAAAQYTTVSYGGVVSTVHDATSGPAGPADIQVGTAVTFSATFDPSRAVDISQTVFNIDHLTGLPVPLPGLTAVSIFDDPNASYRITIGSHVFTSADDDLGGGDFDLGAGHFPLVLYNGAQLLGIDGEADVDGFTFDFDPIATLLHYRAHVGGGYFDADGDYGFSVDTALDAAIAAAPLAPVPEPSTWAMLLGGVAAVALAIRRRPVARRAPMPGA